MISSSPVLRLLVMLSAILTVGSLENHEIFQCYLKFGLIADSGKIYLKSANQILCNQHSTEIHRFTLRYTVISKK